LELRDLYGIQQKCLNGDRGSPNCDKKALHPGKYNSGVHFVGKVQNILISKGFTIKDVIYEQDVEIIVFVPKDEVDALLT